MDFCPTRTACICFLPESSQVFLLCLSTAEGYNLCHGFFGFLIAVMGVNIQSNAGIGMPHQILQAFQIHACICHVCTKCVSEYMRCDTWKRNDIFFIVLLTQSLHHLLNVHGNLWITIFVQQYKSCVAVNHHLFFLLLSIERYDRNFHRLHHS